MGENSTVEEGVKLGSVDTTKDTAVVGNDVVIGKGNDPMINRKAIGYITANYSSTYGSVLLKDRPIASVPFLGRYRLIDFPLSNMMNAGIKTVGVVMPGNYRSLIDHVGSGKDWGTDRKKGGLFMVPGNAYGTTKGGMRFLLRDIISNKTLFQRSDKPYVVMMGTNIIFNMDLNTIIDAHENSGAQMTVVYCKATRNVDDETKLEINENGRLTGVSAGVVYGDNASMDCCIVNRETLLEIIDHYRAADYLDLLEALEATLATSTCAATSTRARSWACLARSRCIAAAWTCSTRPWPTSSLTPSVRS